MTLVTAYPMTRRMGPNGNSDPTVTKIKTIMRNQRTNNKPNVLRDHFSSAGFFWKRNAYRNMLASDNAAIETNPKTKPWSVHASCHFQACDRSTNNICQPSSHLLQHVL